MDEQNPVMNPKPGDVVQPGTPAPVETTTQIVSTPAVTPPITPTPEPEPTPPAVPPPAEPTPTITPLPKPHSNGPLFAIVLFVILLIVGAAVYFLYFKNLMAPAPAPVEIKETSESTTTGRNTPEDTTSLQYLENEFNKLDNETTNLTNEMEAENELNLGTSTNNTSEL